MDPTNQGMDGYYVVDLYKTFAMPHAGMPAGDTLSAFTVFREIQLIELLAFPTESTFLPEMKAMVVALPVQSNCVRREKAQPRVGVFTYLCGASCRNSDMLN